MIESFAERIRQAAAKGEALRIVGGGSKDFYGQGLGGEPLATEAHAGIVDYEPSELFVTVKSGTRLIDLERTLAERGQMLAFEPPHPKGEVGATVGGTIATGLAGPRRVAAGSVRDFVLGMRLLDGKGQDLRFGGTVMKNVAGYDVSRAMVASMGCLALIAEVTLKVLPEPGRETTLSFELDEAKAIDFVNRLAGRPLPLSASAYVDGVLHVRLSGSEAALEAAAAVLGGQPHDAKHFWTALRDHTHPFFDTAMNLWRLSVPGPTSPMELPGEQLIEWHGAQRWLATVESPERIRERVQSVGGHATLYRRGEDGESPIQVFHPLPPAMMAIHRRLKDVFDPHRVFNPGRMYEEF